MNRRDHKGMVSIAHLIEHTAFGDVCEVFDDHEPQHERDASLKMKVFESKLENLSDEFVISIQEEGVKLPVIYDAWGDRLLNGHHRVLVAWLLGIEEIPYDIDGERDDFSLPQGEKEEAHA